MAARAHVMPLGVAHAAGGRARQGGSLQGGMMSPPQDRSVFFVRHLWTGPWAVPPLVAVSGATVDPAHCHLLLPPRPPAVEAKAPAVQTRGTQRCVEKQTAASRGPRAPARLPSCPGPCSLRARTRLPPSCVSACLSRDSYLASGFPCAPETLPRVTLNRRLRVRAVEAPLFA